MSGTALVQYLEEMNFNPGDCLFVEGEESNHFFLIQEGDVEIYIEDSEGHKIELAKLGAGQAVGEFALVAKKPRSATAVAVNAVKAYKISDEGYQKLLQELPDWALSLIESLIERLRGADEVIRKHTVANRHLQQALDGILNTKAG